MLRTAAGAPEVADAAMACPLPFSAYRSPEHSRRAAVGEVVGMDRTLVITHLRLLRSRCQSVHGYLPRTHVGVVGCGSVGRERGPEHLAVSDRGRAELRIHDGTRVTPQFRERRATAAARCRRNGHEVARGFLPLSVGLGIGDPDDAVLVAVGRHRARTSWHSHIRRLSTLGKWQHRSRNWVRIDAVADDPGTCVILERLEVVLHGHVIEAARPLPVDGVSMNVASPVLSTGIVVEGPRCSWIGPHVLVVEGLESLADVIGIDPRQAPVRWLLRRRTALVLP